MLIGNKEFDVNRTYVMGILNVTPDSFSDGGKYNVLDNALKHCEQMIKEGMDIVDIGGESTRPGFTVISDEEEIERTVPVIEAVKREFNIPISLDTYKGNVAKAGIAAGADLINDIKGLKGDDLIARVIAENNVACCIMHNRESGIYEAFMQDVVSDLAESLRIAEKAGIADDKIILDPGVGFGKTTEQNLIVINSMDSLKVFGYPILLGCSRKSVIGNTLNLPVTERVEGTIATSVIGVMKNAMFVRVHDVLANRRAVDMAMAIRNS